MDRVRLRNGTVVQIRDRETLIILPDGTRVHGCPQGEPGAPDPGQVQTAHELGYAGDVHAMVEAHDPLHAWICAELGLVTSYALSGGDPTLAALEEAAVLAVQKFMRVAGGKLSWAQFS